jgi:hypothetical protein
MQGFQQQQQPPTGPYATALLNDIHVNFPALLYLPERFHTVQDLLQYVQQQMSARYDVFTSWRRYYEQMDREAAAAAAAQQPQQQQQPRYNNRYQSRWGQANQNYPQRQPQQPRPQVYVPPSPEVQVTAEVDQAAINALINHALLVPNPATDTLTTTLLRSIFGPFDMNPNPNPNANRTTPFWEPVPVVPTAAQIAAASTTYAAPTVLDTPCAICQDSIAEGAQVRKLTFCNHFFHKECVDNWFLRDTRCPTCRHDVRIRGTNSTSAS